MTSRRSFLQSALGATALGFQGIGNAFAQGVPAGYPADYAALITKAKSERRMSITG